MFKVLILVLFTDLSIAQIPIDKLTHFIAGYAISYTTYNIFENHKKGFTISLLTGLSSGILKESFDYSKGREFSKSDLIWTFRGALTGTVVYKVILNHKQRKNGDMSAWEDIGPYKEGLFDKSYDFKDTTSNKYNNKILK